MQISDLQENQSYNMKLKGEGANLFPTIHRVRIISKTDKSVKYSVQSERNGDSYPAWRTLDEFNNLYEL
jgi:hypothetical protein